MTTITRCILTTVALSLLVYCLSIIQENVLVKNGIASIGRPIRRILSESFSVLDRNLQATDDSGYYFTLTDKSILGSANPDVAVGNPLKGLVTSPAWTGPKTPTKLPTSLEFYYFGLDEIMIGNNKFDWDVLDNVLKEAASRYKHVIWRVYCHYPGRPLAVPEYLLDQGVDIDFGSPVYDDAKLLVALEQFIKALGARYDGHKSLAFVQLGLLGYWGEWHTYPEENLLSDDTKKKVLGWYKNAFKITKLQARDPEDVPGGQIGFHDDSFAYSTLGPFSWYFWPKLKESDNTETWTKNVIGGETSPNLQSIVFESWYRPGSDKNKQDFMECVETTHATYMLHSNAFRDGGYTGTELDNARFAHARLGYNYIITKIAALSTSKSTISVDATITQIGVAPFYYPLSLVLSCPGTSKVVTGLESVLDDTNDSKIYRFDEIPTDMNCLQNMELQLVSTFTYEERPIKFAQGNGSVLFSLPAPEVSNPTILTLMDTSTGTKIGEITDNMVINLSAFKIINILAEPPESFEAGSVEFSVDGAVIRVENLPPFFSGGPINPWRPTVGSHIIKVTPYKEKYLGGSAGVPTIVTVVVIDQKPVPTKSPTIRIPVAPTKSPTIRMPVAPTKSPTVRMPVAPTKSPTVRMPVAPTKSPTTRMPVAPPIASKLSLTLVDAKTNAEISPLTNGMKIDILKYPTLNILVDVDASLSVNRVEFFYDGDRIRIEYNAPYSFYGNDDNDFFGWRPTVGDHFVEVRAFRDASLAASVSITFFTAK